MRGRRRTAIPAAAAAKMRDMIAAGHPAQAIADALKADGVTGVSRSTVGARQREARGSRGKAKVAPAARKAKGKDTTPLPTPDAIPANVATTTLDAWIAKAERAASKAERKGDLSALGAMGRLTAALVEARRKNTPPPVHDPNDDPDMRALGEEVAARLHKLVDQVAPP